MADMNEYMMQMLLKELFSGGKTPEEKHRYYRSRTADMESIINSANTRAGLDSAFTAYKQFDKENDVWPGQWDEAGDIFEAKLNAKRAVYSKMESAYAQSQEYYNTGPLDKEKIMEYDIDDFPDLSKEVAKIGEILDIMGSSKSQFPNYTMESGKQSTEMLKRDMLGRLGTLESSLKSIASTGHIPEEVIELTMIGDPVAVKNEITTNRNMIKQQINSNRSLLNYSKKISARSPNSSIFPPMETDTEDGAAFKALYQKAMGEDKSSYDPEIINSWIEEFTQNDIILKKEFLRWSRTGYQGDIDLDKLINEYNPSKKAVSPDTTGGQKSVNLYGSKDEMKKDIIGRTKAENIDSVLTEVTGRSLDELKKDASNKDKSFFQKLKGTVVELAGFDKPYFKAGMEKSRRGFEGALKVEYDNKLNREINNAENYLAESLWKKMSNEKKSEHKKISNFKGYLSKRMKGQYDVHVNKLDYEGTYLDWIKEQIESSGIYMPIGMGGKWNQ